jgi:acetyl-CoA acetyltransferase
MGPFGVMGATAQFALVLTRYMHQYPSLTFEQLGKIAVTTRYNASFHPGAIFRKPYTMKEYLDSRMLSHPLRLLDCVPIVNGGLAYVVTSAKTARSLTDKPVYLRGFGEMNNYYQGSRALPDITSTGFTVAGPKALAMAGVGHRDIDLFLPYDDFPFIALMTLEDWGFCRKGEGGHFVDEHDMRFSGDFPLSTDGGQLSGGQPGGAIGGFMPLVESFIQLREEAGERQVKGATVAGSCGFGGIPYGRPGRSQVALVFSTEP